MSAWRWWLRIWNHPDFAPLSMTVLSFVWFAMGDTAGATYLIGLAILFSIEIGPRRRK